MNMQLERRADRQFIRLAGDLRCWNHPEREAELLAGFDTTLENAPREVLLNLAEVASIDSLGIGALVRFVVRCAQRNISLKVVVPRGVPGEVIKIIHVFDDWPTFPDEAAALASDAGCRAKSASGNAA
jgi:anti-anti-sigma factor